MEWRSRSDILMLWGCIFGGEDVFELMAMLELQGSPECRGRLVIQTT